MRGFIFLQELCLYPGCPKEEAEAIAEHACRKYSGRVGRSAAAKSLAPETIRLAVVAAIRHQHTRYVSLLMQGVPRAEARAAVSSEIEKCLENWKGG